MSQADIIQKYLFKWFIQRKFRDFPVYSIDTWEQFREFQSSDYLSETRFTLRSRDYGRSCFREAADKDLNDYKNRFFACLENLYPGVREFLIKYRGKIALCGGFFLGLYSSNDVDIFFYDCTREEATAIMEDACYSIWKHCLNNKEMTLKLVRSAETTNILYYLNGVCSRKIQYVQRIYPSFGHILAGFDIPASMVGTDGTEIYATEQGAWTYIHGVNIVDISRRSPSFAFRLMKYCHRGINILFPGVEANVTSLVLAPRRQKLQECRDEINAILSKYYVRVSYADADYDGGWDRSFTLPRLEECGGRETVKLFADFYLNRLDELPVSNKNPVISDYATVGNASFDMYENTLVSLKALGSNKPRGYYTKTVELDGSRRDYITSPELYTIFDFRKIVYDATQKSLITPGCLLNRNVCIELVYNAETFFEPGSTIDLKKFEGRSMRGNPQLQLEAATELLGVICDTVENRVEQFNKRLKRVTWMTQDTDRQWSSTIHPEPIKAQVFYNGYWNGCTATGISENVETLLRLLTKTPGNVWYRMPKDVFNMIMLTLIDLKSPKDEQGLPPLEIIQSPIMPALPTVFFVE